MTFEYMLKERERIGIEQGRAEGLAEGHAAGLSEGRSEGEAIGLKKGRSEGAAQKQREIAKNLKDLGMDTNEIIKATGLCAEEVAKL